MKGITTPDFNFDLDGVECYLEIGSRKANPHKRRQAKVIENVVALRRNPNFIYLQLFKNDIDLMEKCIETPDDLLSFLYNHEKSIYTR